MGSTGGEEEERAEKKKEKKRKMKKRKKGGFDGELSGSTYKKLLSLFAQRKVGYKVFGLIGFGGVVKVPFRG